MQVFDTSPKLSGSHNTKTNSSYRGDAWLEGPCLISLSVTQNNCWLVAVSNLEKRYRLRLKSIALNEKYEINKIIIVLKCKKKCFSLRNLAKISNLILCFLEIPKIFICVGVRLVSFLSEDWRKLSV